MPVRTAYAGAAVSGEVLTAANVNKIPGGWIGYATNTAAQTGVGTTATDLTNLTVTVTVDTSRRIRITGYVPIQQRTSAALSEVDIHEGATRLARHFASVAADQFDTMTPSVILTPTAGSHTYNLKMVTSAGTVDTVYGTDTIAFILVEDLGPDT